MSANVGDAGVVNDEADGDARGDDAGRHAVLTTTLSAEPLPVLLKKDFSNGSDRWQPTDPTKWKIKEVDGNKVFELVEGNSDYKPPFRSPSQCHLQSPTPG